MLVVNHGKPLCHHAISCHKAPILEGFLPFYWLLGGLLQHLPPPPTGSSHGGPGGVTLPWVHCNEVGFLAIPSRKMPYGCLKMGFWLVVLSHLPIWKISEFVSWDDVPFPTEWNKIVPNHQDVWWFPDIYGTLGNIGPIDPSQRTPESSHESAWYHGNSWEVMGYHIKE